MDRLSNPQSNPDIEPNARLSRISGVYLPGKPAASLWDISISADGCISSIDPHCDLPVSKMTRNTLVATNQLLGPSLCHAHIHLDKCFLLQDPKYDDLQLINGDFAEAMSMTSEAKARFTEDDLLRRGRQLIEESISYGVTAMRAFVEIDSCVGLKCLNAGRILKTEYADRCEVQLCAFAQLPLFSGERGGEDVRQLMLEAMEVSEVDVVGSTPYVEENEEKARENIQWMICRAIERSKFLDFHLDYFLDKSKRPLFEDALDKLKAERWSDENGRPVALGHCTRLTLLSDEEMRRLRNLSQQIPICFVGLPTSDLFMMKTETMARGSLHIPDMITTYGFDAAIAVNNIGNAFTPHGNCDPLAVAQLGIGLYQRGTRRDAELLYVLLYGAVYLLLER